MRAAAPNFVDSEVASPAVPVRHAAVFSARVAVAAGGTIWEWMAPRTPRVASHAGLSCWTALFRVRIDGKGQDANISANISGWSSA